MVYKGELTLKGRMCVSWESVWVSCTRHKDVTEPHFLSSQRLKKKRAPPPTTALDTAQCNDTARTVWVCLCVCSCKLLLSKLVMMLHCTCLDRNSLTCWSSALRKRKQPMQTDTSLWPHDNTAVNFPCITVFLPLCVWKHQPKIIM